MSRSLSISIPNELNEMVLEYKPHYEEPVAESDPRLAPVSVIRDSNSVNEELFGAEMLPNLQTSTKRNRASVEYAKLLVESSKQVTADLNISFTSSGFVAIPPTTVNNESNLRHRSFTKVKRMSALKSRSHRHASQLDHIAELDPHHNSDSSDERGPAKEHKPDRLHSPSSGFRQRDRSEGRRRTATSTAASSSVLPSTTNQTGRSGEGGGINQTVSASTKPHSPSSLRRHRLAKSPSTGAGPILTWKHLQALDIGFGDTIPEGEEGRDGMSEDDDIRDTTAASMPQLSQPEGMVGTEDWGDDDHSYSNSDIVVENEGDEDGNYITAFVWGAASTLIGLATAGLVKSSSSSKREKKSHPVSLSKETTSKFQHVDASKEEEEDNRRWD